MNIIGGIAKNVTLEVPKGLEIRPTSVRARKSIFDRMNNLHDFTVVDMCAGSGSFGLEAASRGAAKVYFIELAKYHCSIIRKNITKLENAGVKTNFELINIDALNTHKILADLAQNVDVIFLDPPYSKSSETANGLFLNDDFALWAKNAVIIFETSADVSRKPPFEEYTCWQLENRYKSGQSIFYILKSII